MVQTVLLQPSLHDCYHAGNLSTFKEILYPSSAVSNNKNRSNNLSSSLSRSPGSSRFEHLGSSNAPSNVVNRRDLQGRTVLHLAVSKVDQRSMDFVHALLACPNINVNLQDYESGWTALHRYASRARSSGMIADRVLYIQRFLCWQFDSGKTYSISVRQRHIYQR